MTAAQAKHVAVKPNAETAAPAALERKPTHSTVPQTLGHNEAAAVMQPTVAIAAAAVPKASTKTFTAFLLSSEHAKPT